MSNSVLIIVITILISCYLCSSGLVNSKDIEKFSAPKDVCRGYLTDIEYLEHMIPHHQVAIDISIELLKITKSPLMKDILRKLIFNQKMEIILMNVILRDFPINVSNKISKGYLTNSADYIEPNVVGLSKTYCDPHFFDPKGHMKHLEHMKLDDKSYLEHMIPHHQVAVDMSKVLLNNTKNDFMVYLAYRIIRNQTAEIIYLNGILTKTLYVHKSDLI
tara:strand:+ start:329 stop:982 length:654 start_codon:yes stop_codon:yes gene_type:complete